MDIESRNLFVHLIYPDSPVKPAVSFSGLGQHCIDSHSYSWDGLRRMQDGGIALIQYTVRGRGALEYGGRCYPVEPGQAMQCETKKAGCAVGTLRFFICFFHFLTYHPQPAGGKRKIPAYN